MADLTQELLDIAYGAGEKIMAYYGSDLAVTSKTDDSPLTKADLAAHHHIVDALAQLTPDIPVISEESAQAVAHDIRADWARFWLVDPLDGTKEFIKQTGSFTVNIGLVEHGIPSVGIVHAPATGITYVASPEGGAKKIAAPGQTPAPIAATTASLPDPPRIVASRDHAGPAVTALLAKLHGAECLSIGSSLKFCLVAEGAADIYLRDVPTMEWDTAAAHAVVLAAGAKLVVHPGHTPLAYNKPDLRNPSIVTATDQGLALLKSI